jgi:hypothetical protein
MSDEEYEQRQKECKKRWNEKRAKKRKEAA